MASKYIYKRDTRTDFVETDRDSLIDELKEISLSDNGTSADNVSLPLDESWHSYSKQSNYEIQDMLERRPTKRNNFENYSNWYKRTSTNNVYLSRERWKRYNKHSDYDIQDVPERRPTKKEHFENYTYLDNGTSADNIPLLLDEVRQSYNVHSHENIPDIPERRPPKREAESAFEEAINNLKDFNDARTHSCAYCSEEKRVEYVSSLRRGQHISMPGKHGKLYLKTLHKLCYLYKHHAIVKNVQHIAGTRVKMVLIHFSKENGSTEIRESTKTYDLKNDEIYIISYKYPRYTADEIVRRAESMLPENGEKARQFSTYNVAIRNCEHFATWCVVGSVESFQVQELKEKIASGMKSLFGDGSYIAKVIIRLLEALSDDIAVRLTRAINIPGIVLGGNKALYLIYCIVMTAVHILNYKKGQMCWCCLKETLQEIWLTFSVFNMTSTLNFIIFNFALPLMAPAVGIPLRILLILLSACLQWSVPKIRKALQNPFSLDKTAVKSLSEVNLGDMASVTYHGEEHVIIVSQVDMEKNNYKRGCVQGIHYRKSHLFCTPEITEECLPVDLAKSKMNLYDCRHLLCFPAKDVISRARKRVGEKKWAIRSNRSYHFLEPSGFSRESGKSDLEESKTKTLSSLFIEKKEAHLTSDIRIGDVVQFEDTGIVVGKVHLDGVNGRRCHIKMIVYDLLWYGRCRNYRVNFNEDRVFVWRYHPAHCFPMDVRAERAMEMINRQGRWWTDQGFIEHCIMLNP